MHPGGKFQKGDGSLHFSSLGVAWPKMKILGKMGGVKGSWIHENIQGYNTLLILLILIRYPEHILRLTSPEINISPENHLLPDELYEFSR